MAITTSNTAPYPDLVNMCHQFYALGKRITDYTVEYSISNTVMNGVCVEIKGARTTTNTVHVAILASLAGN